MFVYLARAFTARRLINRSQEFPTQIRVDFSRTSPALHLANPDPVTATDAAQCPVSDVPLTGHHFAFLLRYLQFFRVTHVLVDDLSAEGAIIFLRSVSLAARGRTLKSSNRYVKQ